MFQIKNKKYKHSCDLILSFLKVVFWEKSELSRARVFRLNLSIENPLNISIDWLNVKCSTADIQIFQVIKSKHTL